MPTLKDKLDEMARIKAELQRMEEDDTVTEETEGDVRDTLIARWEQLDTESKPIIERMERIRGITRTAGDEGNLERPTGRDTPDLVIRNNRDPYEDLPMVRQKLVSRADLRARGLDAIELEAKRGNLPHDLAETATLRAQDSPGIARHMLLTGSEDYQEAFRAYLENPEENAQRAALSLT